MGLFQKLFDTEYKELIIPESFIKTGRSSPFNKSGAKLLVSLFISCKWLLTIFQPFSLNHDFFVFKNVDEECVSVMYKRRDGQHINLHVSPQLSK